MLSVVGIPRYEQGQTLPATSCGWGSGRLRASVWCMMEWTTRTQLLSRSTQGNRVILFSKNKLRSTANRKIRAINFFKSLTHFVYRRHLTRPNSTRTRLYPPRPSKQPGPQLASLVAPPHPPRSPGTCLHFYHEAG